jgi:uncharacterized membrane protein YbaN (DUF454 family)
MNRLVMLTLGYGFLMLGVLGLFLPFLQGFLFLLVGLLILARHAAWAQRALNRLKRTHPKAGELIESAETIADRWTDKLGAWWHGVWRRVAGR